MMYASDFHIHSEASYDARLTVSELFAGAAAQGITEFGTADHVNLPSWKHYLLTSEKLHDGNPHPGFHLGVELTTISGFEHDYDRLHGSLEGYVRPDTAAADPVALPLDEEELIECGVEYTIGAAHWLLTPSVKITEAVRDFHRQQMYLACDSRVDIVGHPFCIHTDLELPNGARGVFDDLSVVPDSFWDEFASALLENKKYVEYNVLTYAVEPYYPEKFRYDYAEKLRYLFERGVPVTIGSDEHGESGMYGNYQEQAARYLKPAGFKAEDFSIPSFKRDKQKECRS